MKKILIVDSDPYVGECVQMALATNGHEAQTALHGSEALARCEKHRYDLVITEFQMHDMTGDQLADALKVISPQLPILMLTTHAEELWASGNTLSAVDSLVAKPFQIDDLLLAVSSLLDGHQVRTNTPLPANGEE